MSCDPRLANGDAFIWTGESGENTQPAGASLRQQVKERNPITGKDSLLQPEPTHKAVRHFGGM